MSTAQKVQSYLESNCKVFRRGDTWRCTSPLRPDSDSDSFAVKFDADEYGTWKDHVSGESGSLYELAERLNISLPDDRAPVEDTSRGYDGLADYAKAHGVDVDVFKAAGWQETTHHQRPALSFPTASGTRYRFLDDGTPKYINPTGYSACWYGLEKAIAAAKRRNLPLVICNGEASTVVATHHGVPACATTAGEGKLPPPLLDELQKKWTGRVLIALDCDDTGRKAAHGIAEQVTNSAVIDLGLSDKGDLADFCKLHEEDSLDDLLSLAPPERVRKSTSTLSDSRLANFITATATPGIIRGLKTGMPSIDKALSGLVGGRSVVLYGDTGAGKSTLCASWAVNLGKQAPGMIFTTEIPGEAYMDKLACAIAQVPFNKIEDGTTTQAETRAVMEAYDKLKQLYIEFEDAKVEPDDVEDMVAQAKRDWGCAWIIVDSISKIARGADYEKVTDAANALQDACIQLDIPMVSTSQIGRNLKDRKNKIPTLHDGQGSGFIEQNSDYVLAIYNHHYYVSRGEAEPDDRFPEGTSSIICLKDRWRGNTGMAWQVTNVAGAAFYETARERVNGAR